MPLYSPSIEELRKLIEKNGCFGIARLETLPPMPVPLPSAEECRSGFESILRKHFRSEIIEQLFQRYSAKIAGQPPVKTIDGFAIGLFVILKRNV
ncbi:S-ADENOSYL-L-METHIONINE:CARBOXYL METHYLTRANSFERASE FAMILY PROTEIN [Salix koriyanagi]|uniref:S-ADENOSYL-L-METHIONINE:CARBOXYL METHYLTRANSFERASE FAMILY PROTEIN n=1 Tax=Salix koriyanagi TaxID=2511006 RepID=A0A9Q0UNQ0_9ROSI|nr:S-ADENOSYL-L-METHIONINE:CARBOXYL METHYLTRANSFERASE FAMILY PROTEIN [Salix koriyanagi]